MSAERRRFEIRLLPVALLALCMGGAWVSGQLVKEDAGLWDGAGGTGGLFGQVCQAAEDWGLGGCGRSSREGWGHLTLPAPAFSGRFGIEIRRASVPLSFVGLSYFMFLGVWFALVDRSVERGHGWQRVPLIVSALGASVSVVCLGVMAAGLAPRCLWCFAVHGINLLAGCCIWRLVVGSRHFEADASGMGDSGKAFGVPVPASRQAARAAVLWLFIVGGLWVYRGERLELHEKWRKLLPYKALVASLQEDPEFLLREYRCRPQHVIPLRRSEPVTAGAAELTIFTDFECPGCYCKSKQLKQLSEETFGGRLSIRVRHYPLCGACNGEVRGGSHPNACNAARAAEAARILGGERGFWRMHDLLFEHRQALCDQTYLACAVRIGLDPDDFARCMRSDAVGGIVASDIAMARRIGVKGTPTLLLNGRRVTALCQTPTFWKAVAHAQESSGVGPAASASLSESAPVANDSPRRRWQ